VSIHPICYHILYVIKLTLL